jgi:hypothetical protein
MEETWPQPQGVDGRNDQKPCSWWNAVTTSPHVYRCPRSTTERRCDIITPHSIGTKATQLQSTLSSSREAPPGITVQGAEEVIKAGKKMMTVASTSKQPDEEFHGHGVPTPGHGCR